MYNQYATPFSYHGLHINYPKTFQNLKSQFPSQLYSMNIYIHTTTYFYQVKVFPKVTNTHLYINQKEIKQEIS
jgi:hypothetical protein